MSSSHHSAKVFFFWLLLSLLFLWGEGEPWDISRTKPVQVRDEFSSGTVRLLATPSLGAMMVYCPFSFHWRRSLIGMFWKLKLGGMGGRGGGTSSVQQQAELRPWQGCWVEL